MDCDLNKSRNESILNQIRKFTNSNSKVIINFEVEMTEIILDSKEFNRVGFMIYHCAVKRAR